MSIKLLLEKKEHTAHLSLTTARGTLSSHITQPPEIATTHLQESGGEKGKQHLRSTEIFGPCGPSERAPEFLNHTLRTAAILFGLFVFCYFGLLLFLAVTSVKFSDDISAISPYFGLNARYAQVLGKQCLEEATIWWWWWGNH